MANTERLGVIRMLREARMAVGTARFDPGLTVKDRRRLERAYIELDSLEGTLILQEIRDRVDALASDSARLEKLAQEMRQSASELKAIAEMIDRAAKAVAALAEIAAKASSAGIL
jgi:hypothetical protein